MSRTFLITGGAGFIGSHLTDRLLAQGDEVVVIDNLSTGRMENLSDASSHKGLHFIQGSILDPLIVDETVRDVDHVVHLAAAVGVKLIVEQPLRSLITNVRGTEVVLDAAHRYRKPILIASSSEIYGKNDSGPLTETADRIVGSPLVARWAYGTAKAVDEILALTYHRERGLPTSVVRLFNTVGPRQSPAYGMVIPRFVQQALAGDPITIFGDGTQSRCFGHVSDIVGGIAALLESEAAIGEVFNLGAPDNEVTILDLADTVVARMGSASPVAMIPYDQAYATGFEDMYRRVPDITKVREAIGWSPVHTLDDILDDAIADAKNQDAIPTLPLTSGDPS